MPTYWNQLYGWNDSTTTMTSNVVWPAWVNGVNTQNYLTFQSLSTSTTMDTVWFNWIGNGIGLHYQPWGTPIPEARPVNQAFRNAQRERAVSVDEAKRRATSLLVDHLTADQRAEFEAQNGFTVVDRHGRRYRISRKIAGNVRLLGPDGRTIFMFCAHPANVPAEDAMLCSKLMLECDLNEFWRISNITDGATGTLVSRSGDLSGPAIPDDIAGRSPRRGLGQGFVTPFQQAA